METTKAEEYYQAKDVLKSPEKYHELDVVSAKNYCRGYEDATTSQKQIIERLRVDNKKLEIKVLEELLEDVKCMHSEYIIEHIQEQINDLKESYQLLNTTEPTKSRQQ